MEQTQIKGHIQWEILKDGKWESLGDNHNVTNIQYKQALATSLAGGAQVVANKMSAGTINTSFTTNSTDLGNTVGITTSLTNSVSGAACICVGTIFFSGSYTIQEVGLWSGNTPLAFGNVNQAVTLTTPIRITWTVNHL